MKGDFTRNTFEAKNFFNRVLMQQGRVTLDADFNEQVDILLYYMRMLARDLIGPYAAPSEDPGFKISADKDGIWISAGRYYVDGILVENKKPCLYSAQPNYQPPPDDELLKLKEKKNQVFWLYLDVWERHITWIENDAIREKALSGPDTCTRSQVVWQVKALPVEAHEDGHYSAIGGFRSYEGYAYRGYAYGYSGYDRNFPCDAPLGHLADVSKVQMAARVDPGKKNIDACVTPPDSKYVGVENHLYRVEIHEGGNAGVATFKWSRDNGSVATPWLGTNGDDLVVANTRDFSAGNWVELTDENLDLHEIPGMLVKVAKVEGGVLSLDPASIPAPGLPDQSKLLYPKVRRWDQTEKGDISLNLGAVPVVETPTATDAEKAQWIDLEDGIQIAFAQMPFAGGGKYRPGDYWLIPARVATGAIEWPPAGQAEKMSLVAPGGVVHHYAPLAFVLWDNDDLKTPSCYCEFDPISACFRRGLAFGIENLFAARENRILEVESETMKATPTAIAAAKKPARRPPAKKKQN